MIALPLSCPVFIGRRDELDVLNDARRALARSAGSIVLVGGEAGIGKSRLVAQFARHLGDKRVRTLASAECRQDVVEPLRPVRTLLELLLAQYVPEDLPPSAQRVLGRFAPETATPYGREAASGAIDRADAYAGLAAIFFAYAAKRSTILIIEDVHWADPSTLDFLAYLAERIDNARLLVVATHRTEELETNRELLRALTQLGRSGAVRRVELEPFAGRELREFVMAVLGDRATIEDAALESILVRSEGNAFYAEELLKDAVTRGGRRDARLPLSIRGAIVQRLSAFDEPERRVLSYAAVLGLRFDPLLLATILERDIEEIRPVLARARDAALVIDDPERTACMRFRHALTRQVIYDDLLAFDRQRLHARILRVLEDTVDAYGSGLYALAEHAAAAGDPALTLAYGERAGNAAWSLGAYAEAITCFERALAVARDEDDRARLLELLAFPVSYGGDCRRAIALWSEALEVRKRRGDHHVAPRLHQMILCERFNSGDRSDEGAASLAYIAEHGAAMTTHGRDSMYVTIAVVRSELCHVDTIDDVLDKIENLSGLAPAILQNVYRTELNRAAYFGNVAEWRAAYDRLLGLSPLHSNPSVDAVNVVDHLTSVVVSGLHLGVNAEIEAALFRGRALASESARRYLPYYDAIEAAYALTRGRLDIARSLFESAISDTQYLTRSLLARISPYLSLALDDASFVDRAIDEATIERERAALREDATSQYSRLLLGGYALWLDRIGRTAEAETYLGEALGGVPFASPRFASLLTFAMRHIGAERIPDLEPFAERHRCAGDFAEAAAAYELSGFALDAAHAYHRAGDFDRATAAYEHCGAVAYFRPASALPVSLPTASAEWSLSEREVIVAELVSLGLTNVAIAERMYVSHKTIEKYLSSIFVKLGVHSRSQIAARLVNHGPGATLDLARTI